ncbi:MAG: hypothetical protein LBJ94_00835 [Puniceicoccales bacterium]|jgi:hypothetical protein|nr:hypothetical protein [Puniceicoccales bacterium]
MQKDSSSVANYGRFNSAVNPNISRVDPTNMQVGDKTMVHGSKEQQNVERIEKKRDKDFEISTKGVNNAISGPRSPEDIALNKIVAGRNTL